METGERGCVRADDSLFCFLSYLTFLQTFEIVCSRCGIKRGLCFGSLAQRHLPFLATFEPFFSPHADIERTIH